MTSPLGDALGKLGGYFGGSNIAEQFLVWGVLQQLFGAALASTTSDISQAVNSANPVIPLTPEQAAVAAVRGFMTADQAGAEAAKSGIGAGRFNLLAQLAAQPPSLGLIIAAYQRGIIVDGDAASGGLSLQAALADLGVAAQWADVVKALTVEIPPAQQVMQAWLEGQIEEPEANQRYLAAGGDPTWFQTSYNAQGEAPTPVELLEMLNRGLIPQGGTGPDATTYDQGFLEGPWRNKWEAAFLGLRYYLPPPRTVTALLKEGAITEAEATQYLQAQGLDPTLTAIYIAAASHSTTVAQREFTQAQVVDLYESKLIDETQAVADLVALRFTAADAALLLAQADQKQAASAVKSAVTRLQNLYLSGTNTLVTTQAALHGLGLTDANVANLIATWNLEQAAKVRTLTAAEIAAGFYYGSITQATALARLQADGYSFADAQIVLSNRIHALLPNQVAI